MSGPLALGLGAALMWILILLWSDARPAQRFWPPNRGNVFTAAWAWVLTILIYVGLIRTASADWNALDLPMGLRWGLGGTFSVVGSVIQSWGTLALGLKGTSGWHVGLVHQGPYARMRHPQYAGQIGMLMGVALISGTDIGWMIVALATVALVMAARVEDRFLAALHPEHDPYREKVRAFV
ncbi:MAG: hypothetical protein HUJ27_06695 [Rhodobacteraceae bacterium]|nr:hypothetical protein [Paracoccaceae bacterium]